MVWNLTVATRSSCSRRYMYRPAFKVCHWISNDSEKVWEKTLWSDETEVELFGNNSTRLVWRMKKNASMTERTPFPQSSMEVETFCFGAVFVQRLRHNFITSRGQWTEPCSICSNLFKSFLSKNTDFGSRAGLPAWQWSKTYNQGNKGVAQQEAYEGQEVASSVSRPQPNRKPAGGPTNSSVT